MTHIQIQLISLHFMSFLARFSPPSSILARLYPPFPQLARQIYKYGCIQVTHIVHTIILQIKYTIHLCPLFTLSLASLLPLLISLTSQSRSLDIQINMHISYINTIINTII